METYYTSFIPLELLWLGSCSPLAIFQLVMNTPSTFTRFNNSTTSKSTISFSSSIQNSSIPPPHNPANNGLLILSSIPITDKILHIFSLFVNSSYLHFQQYSKLFMNTSHSHEYGTTTTVHHERMTNIIESSQSFRQIMNTYLENLVDDEISKLCTTEELDQLDVIIDVINDIHKLWLATEILLLSPSETISTDVVTWLQVYKYLFFVFFFTSLSQFLMTMMF